LSLYFDIKAVTTTEFGVGRDDGDNQSFGCVTVDGEVQVALREMAAATWDAMERQTKTPAKYEPSDKHASSEYVYLPLDDDLAAQMRKLHEANNLPVDATALSEPLSIFCYFARMTDRKGRRLTSLRRATQFKGVLKSRLIRLVTDALKLVEDRVFKLDNDFDLMIDPKRVHILRPSGFEFAGQLQAAILEAVPKNITAIQKDLGFVEFAGIQEYARKHPRAARYLASIRAQKETKGIDKNALKKLCRDTGVDITESKGKITVQEDHVLGFLEVLDRRRYELELVKGSRERFKAASRRKIEG
jgi:hypothetical protein